MDIPFFFNKDALVYGIKNPIGWNLEKYPMCLVVGSTGSGKTYAVMTILAKIKKYMPESRFWLCDYKNYDYAKYAGLPRHYGYEDCTKGLQDYYNEFTARLRSGNKSALTPNILMFDELGGYYSSLSSSKEKKQIADEARAKFAEIAMLGRVYRCYCIIALQRADSEHFKSGSRDQFSAIVGMGNLSKEQKMMLFSDYREEMTENCGRGQGHLSLDGKGLFRIVVPTIAPENMPKVEQYIKTALS